MGFMTGIKLGIGLAIGWIVTSALLSLGFLAFQLVLVKHYMP